MSPEISKSPMRKVRKIRNIGFSQILRYHYPIQAKISILHRVSGVLLFVALPFLLYLLDQSLASELSFSQLQITLTHWPVQLALSVTAWAISFHSCAGLRHVLMDLHLLQGRKAIQSSAYAVVALSSLLTLWLGFKIF